jgi:hypothetical protein
VDLTSRDIASRLRRAVERERPETAFSRAMERARRKGARKEGYSDRVTNSAEFARILNIPRRKLDLDSVLDLTPIFHKEGGTMRLRPIQSAALLEAHYANGLFAPINVGGGKTLTTLLLTEAMDSTNAVLLVPPQLRNQLAREIEHTYAPSFHLPTFFFQHEGFYIEGTTDEKRLVTVVAYSELSLAKNTGLLEELGPDLVIADECHLVKNPSSARTKRFLRYMRQSPQCRFAALSGTMASRSIKDYAHLLELALRKNSVLPIDHRELQTWAGALDVKSKTKTDPGVLRLFCEDEDAGNVRKGFRRRLTDTLGVVTTTGIDKDIGASLLIQSIGADAPAEVKEALAEVSETWSYNGGEFESALSYWRFCREMSMGFYYVWDWPTPDGKPSPEDHEWLERRAAWHKEIREKLKNSRAGMDSPLLLTNAADRWRLSQEDHSNCIGEWTEDEEKEGKFRWECQTCLLRSGPEFESYCTGNKPNKYGDDAKLWHCEEYLEWIDVKHRYSPTPPRKPINISEFVSVDAVCRAQSLQKKGRRVILWYEQVHIGEQLERIGRFPHYGAGEDASEATEPIIICSIMAQGTGKNLQFHYDTNIITVMPTGNKQFEQLVGRTHRSGQEADEVQVYYYAHTEALSNCMYSVVSDAIFIEEAQGQPQKALYADGERQKEIIEEVREVLAANEKNQQSSQQVIEKFLLEREKQQTTNNKERNNG